MEREKATGESRHGKKQVRGESDSALRILPVRLVMEAPNSASSSLRPSGATFSLLSPFHFSECFPSDFDYLYCSSLFPAFSYCLPPLPLYSALCTPPYSLLPAVR